jgi:vitamin B12 transporter
MNGFVLIGIALFCCSCKRLNAQDTVSVLPEVECFSSVEAMRLHTLRINSQSMEREQLLLGQPADIGAVLQRFSGIALKSYGGIGGLKTVSVRGLGSQHTHYLIDGFSIVNTQTGQINVGQVQADNVESIVLSSEGKNGFLLPASSYQSGSIVSIYTFENTLSSAPFRIRACARWGSFGEKDHYLSTKFQRKNVYFSVFGKWRQVEGAYSYKLQNGNTILSGHRLNSDVKDWYSGVSFGWEMKNDAKIRVIYRTNGADQGLPGAVILYNSTSDQRMTTKMHSGNMDYTHHHQKLYYRFFGSLSSDQIHYVDPSFLNNSGGISTTYYNLIAQGGLSMQRPIKENFIVYGGVDSKYSKLQFSTINSSIPVRFHSFGLTGCTFSKGKWRVESQLTAQQVMEENKGGEKAENLFRANPFFSVERKEIGQKNMEVRAFYRNSFRMPSFNELYYNNIGNVQLKPEKAQQLSLGFSIRPLDARSDLKVVLNGYFNTVEDQILAIPTKNLFIWSMQNIGKVAASGVEARLVYLCAIRRWLAESSVNYSYQKSVDISDATSPTYKHQVAYIPIHTANCDLTLKRKNTGVHFSANVSSLRYSLMENIVANEVAGFALLDMGVFTKWSLVHQQDVRIQISVKNVLNTSYAYIRYFVMPGRNVLITLNYALH